MPKNPHANFSPVLDGYSGIGAFRFWCQTALPLTYDDSLSYYELLNKVVNYLNHTIDDLTAVENNTSALADAYNKLQKYVNDYFDDLDIEAELRNVLDAMAEDGTLDALLAPIVENQLPGVVEGQIDNVVAEQIDGAVAGQIDESVADQLPALVEAGIPGEVSDWLDENVSPVGSAVMVDSSLTISGAAADAKVTGDKIREIKTEYDNHLLQKVVDATITPGEAIKSDGDYIGRRVDAATWARTGLWNGHPTRTGFDLPDDNYTYRIHYYDSTGNINTGAGYLGYSGSGKTGVQYIPKTFNGSPVEKVCVCFRRTDLATMTENDAETLRNEFVSFSATDVTLTYAEIPADAKATGDKIAELSTSITNEAERINRHSERINWHFNVKEKWPSPAFIAGTIAGGTGIVNTGESWRYNACMQSTLSVHSILFFHQTGWRMRAYYYDKYGEPIGYGNVYDNELNVEEEAYNISENAARFRLMLCAWDEVNDVANTSAENLPSGGANLLGKEVEFYFMKRCGDTVDLIDGNIYRINKEDIVQGFWAGRAVTNTVVSGYDPSNYGATALGVRVKLGDILHVKNLKSDEQFNYIIYDDDNISHVVNDNTTDMDVRLLYDGYFGISFCNQTADTAYNIDDFQAEIWIEKRDAYYTDAPLSGLKKMGFNISDEWTTAQAGMQGIAISNGILFQALSSTNYDEIIQLYNMEDHSKIAEFSAPIGHGNTLTFGSKKYNNADEFPLLYASGITENNTRVVHVIRITRENAELIRTYTLPSATIVGHHAQASIDEVNDRFIISAYKDQSWTTYTEGNKIIVSISKPISSALYDEISGTYLVENDRSFELPWYGYLQQCRYYAGYYWILFSQPSVDDTMMYVIDCYAGYMPTTMSKWPGTALTNEAEGFDFLEDDTGNIKMILAVAKKTYYTFTLNP